MPQYISDNTDDEISHARFLNAYLRSKGAQPVNLDAFRKLPSSKATGARQIGRLTNLQALDVDTSWYTRYRSARNPDLGASFPQAVTIKKQPAIPVSDQDTPPNHKQPTAPPFTAEESRMQAIANTAGFHFAMIEQGGSSLYSTMALKASSLEVLRIVVSIGGVETNHFSLWHDKAGNAVSQPLAGVIDPETGLHFPDLNASGGEATQTNLILPEPTTVHPRPARRLDRAPHARSQRRCGGGDQGPDRRPAVQGPVTAVLPHRDAAGQSGRRRTAPPQPLEHHSRGRGPEHGSRPTHPNPKGRTPMFTGLLQPTHLIILLAIALIFLGPKRLPDAGRALGQGLREFKHSIGAAHDDEHQLSKTAAATDEEKPPVSLTLGTPRARATP